MKKIIISFIAVPVIVIAAGICVTWIELNREKKVPVGIDNGEYSESVVSVRISREAAVRSIPYQNQGITINF